MEPEHVTADRLIRELLLPHRNESSSTITFNAGGAGVWIAITCCLVMAAVLAIAVPVGVGAYLDTQAQIRQLENTDNAIRAYINTGKMPPLPPEKK